MAPNTRTIPLYVFSILSTVLSLEAQFLDRLYPFAELTDEMRDRIDLKDGSVEDWLEVLGEPTFTPLDFVTFPPDSYDPSSLDFRIWVAWHDAGNHLFVAAESADDFHVSIDREGWESNPLPFIDASVWFYVDGDRSGGVIFDDDRSLETHNNDMIQAQWYCAFGRTYTHHSNVTLVNVHDAPWVQNVPFADGGGEIIDSQPILTVVEFYVTPFDLMVWDDPEQSVVSDLFSGKTIGFAFQVLDGDTEDSERVLGPVDRWHGLFGPDLVYDQLMLGPESDLWARGILWPAGSPADDTAMENDSWGRIKASLSK